MVHGQRELPGGADCVGVVGGQRAVLHLGPVHPGGGGHLPQRPRRPLHPVQAGRGALQVCFPLILWLVEIIYQKLVLELGSRFRSAI